MEVEPLDETQLEDLGLNTCNHDIPLSYREVPIFDEPEPQPQLLPNCPSLDVSLGDKRGPEPPIKPHSLHSFRMKVLDNLNIHTPPSPHVASSYPKDMYCYYHPCIDDPKKHYGFKPGLLGHSRSLGVDFSSLEMIDDDWKLKSKEVSFLGRRLIYINFFKENEKKIFTVAGDGARIYPDGVVSPDSIIPLGQKNTLAEYMILFSADNRPPMLNKDLYDSWKSRMELYMQNREHERMILESVEHSPLIWPTVKENWVTRTKKYAELFAAEKIQADCDMKATNIILKGLPADIYSLVNHHRVAKDLWERVQLLMQGDVTISCLNKAMDFLTPVAFSRFLSTNNQLRTFSNPRNQATIQDGMVIVQQVQGRQGQSYSGTGYKSNATSSGGNNASRHARVVKCYNCQGEGHEEQLAFLADPGVSDGQDVQTIIVNNAAFQTEDLDTYDSDCDDSSNAKAVLMANISNYDSDVISEKAQRIKPTLYDGIVISAKHVAMHVIADEATLILEEESRSKIFWEMFTPQQELSAEQAFWLRISNPTIKSSNKPPVKVEVLSELPKVSLVNASLKKLKFHLAQFDSVVKKRTTPDAYTEVDKQCLKISRKELLLENDRLLQQIMSQDVLLTMMNHMSLIGKSVNMERKRNESCEECFNLDAELLKSQNTHNDLLKSYSQLEKHCITLELSIELNQEIFQKHESCDNQNALEILEFFENNDLKFQLQEKDTTIYQKCGTEKECGKISSQNERLCKEINHVKQVFKDQFDSIKKTRVRTKEQSDSLIDILNLKSAENEDLKAQIQDKEQADILQGIVKQAKAKQPLDNALDFVCKHAQRIQELLVYVRDTSPNAIKLSAKRLLPHLKTMSRKLGLKCSTSNYGSKPTCNKKNDRISQTPSRNMKNKVEAQPRKVNNKNRVVEPIYDVDVKQSLNSELICATRKKSMFNGVHDMCLLDFVENVNSLETQKPELKVYSKKQKNVKNVGLSKKAKIVESKNANHSKPNNAWGSKDTDIPSFSSLVMTGCPDCSLRIKDEAPEAIIKCIKNIQVRLNSTIRNVRTYNGTKFANQTLCEFYEHVGISHQTSVTRTPQQNGVVERQNRTLVEAARTILIFFKAPLFLWAEAINTACYTQNRSLICLRYNKTPYDLMRDKKPDLSFFHVFGALCYPTNDNDNLGKLDAKADIGIFIGYAPAKKVFRIYNRRTQKSIETIHVTFDELSLIASEQFSLGPGLHLMTLATSSSGLVPNTISQQPCIPPKRYDWDHLFQHMFDEYFNPPSIVVSPVQEARAPRAVVLADSPVSTSIDQDAPSTSIPSTQKNNTLQTFLKKYGLLSTDSADTPMVGKNKLDEYLQGTPVDATLYHGMIVSLMYLTSSRPDLIYAVCLYARTLDVVHPEALSYEVINAFATIIKKCLSGKETRMDKICLSRAQILWGMFYKKNIDYVYLLWEDFLFQIENKDAKKTNKLSYPRFTKIIIDYFMSKDQPILQRNKMFWHTARDDTMFTSMRCISRHEKTQVYGAILPKDLTNQAMLESKVYKTYYAFASGEKNPKPKYVRKKADFKTSPKQKLVQATKGTRLKTSAKVAKSDKKKQPAKMSKAKGLDVLSNVALTEAEQLKLATKRSKTQFHSSYAVCSGDGVDTRSKVPDEQQQKVSGTNKGAGVIPEIPDVPKYDPKSEEESWTFTVSSILSIVDMYLASKMKEAVDVAVQLQFNKLREEAQVKNQEFLNQVDSTMKEITKEQVQA
nr:hypothetical protein [Tanacetum cinerariifolium]